MAAPTTGTGPSAPSAPWTCQYRGCKSKKSQIKELRARLPTGYPHDEDVNLRVCTVCRRLPLADQLPLDQLPTATMKETLGNYSRATMAQFTQFASVAAKLPEDSVEPLDRETVLSVIEDLEDMEAKANEISSVLRYYGTNHANQLAKAICRKILDDGFPWEMSLAFEQINDLVMEEIARLGTASQALTPLNGSSGGVAVPASFPPAGGTDEPPVLCEPVQTASIESQLNQSYQYAFGVLFPKFLQCSWERIKEIAEDDANVSRKEEQKKLFRVVNQWKEIHLWGLGTIKEQLLLRKQQVLQGTVFKKAVVGGGGGANLPNANNNNSSSHSQGAVAVAPEQGQLQSQFPGVSNFVGNTIFTVNLQDIELMLATLDLVQQEEDKEEERELKKRKLDSEEQKQAQESRKNFIEQILEMAGEVGLNKLTTTSDSPGDINDDAGEQQTNLHLRILGLDVAAFKKNEITVEQINKTARKLMFKAHPDKNPSIESQKCTDAMTRITDAKEALVEKLDPANQKKKQAVDPSKIQVLASSSGGAVKQKQLCRFVGCTDEVCSQCAHGACRSHITHCHFFARQNPGLRCFFHPPPRENAVNAVLVNGRWQQKKH
ncbi:unnamed protein product [Amoebophrya sp. A120]|nr:unnamed protein product [Amoebophrya sp. A120]|eukprot:GSA120T00024773001.1